MYKYEKYSYEEFILRLRSIENKKNVRQLALAMELIPDTLAQMKMRAKIPFESAIGYCEKTGYSLDKLFFDKDFKASDDSTVLPHENNNKFYNYKLYNSNDYVRLPRVSAGNSLKAIELNHDIMLYDENINKFDGNGSYLINTNDAVSAVNIFTKIDGDYAYNYIGFTVANELSKEQLVKLNIIGKVIKTFSFW